MIFHCPACRELANATHAVIEEDGTRAGVVCPACDEVAWLEVSEAPEASSPSAGAPLQPSVPSSPRATKDEALLKALELDAASPAEEALLKELSSLTSRWDDYDAHSALLRRAQALGALPAFGVRYRRVLDARPDDEIAKRAQQEIVTLAMASLSTMPGASTDSDPAARQRVIALVLTGVFLAGTLALVSYFLTRL